MIDRKGRRTYHLYRGLGTALAKMPEPLADGIAGIVGQVLSRRKKGPRDLRAHHMRRVLTWEVDGRAPSEETVRHWVHKSFRAYARYWVEGARLSGIPIEVVNRRLSVESGYEYLTEGMAAGKGVVMVLPHVGSWEWGGRFLASQGYPMTSVAERIEPPELFDWFVRQREEMGLTIVPLEQASGAKILKTLRDGGLVGLLCDRDLLGTGVPVEFFGETTTFPAGPATLAMRTGAMLIAGVVYSGPGKSHTSVLSPPLDTTRTGSFRTDTNRITQDIAREFEGFIRRAPDQWHIYQRIWPSDPPLHPGVE